MTLTITIPIFEVFWSLHPDLRMFIGFALMATIFIFFGILLEFNLNNPFIWSGLFFTTIALLSLLHYSYTEMIPTIINSMGGNYSHIQNFEFPIVIVLK